MQKRKDHCSRHKNLHAYETMKELNNSSDYDKGDCCEMLPPNLKKYLLESTDLILQFIQTNADEQTLGKGKWHTDSYQVKYDEEECGLEKCTFDGNVIFDDRISSQRNGHGRNKKIYFFKFDPSTDLVVPDSNYRHHEENLEKEDQENERNPKNFLDEENYQCQGLDTSFAKNSKDDDNSEDASEQIKPKEDGVSSGKIAFESLQSRILHSNISSRYLQSSGHEIDFNVLLEVIPAATRNRLSCNSVLFDQICLETNIYQLGVHYQSGEINEFQSNNINGVHDTLKCANFLKKMPLSVDSRSSSASKVNLGMEHEKKHKDYHCRNTNIAQTIDRPSYLEVRRLVRESSSEHSHQNLHAGSCFSGNRQVLSRKIYINLCFYEWNCRRCMNGSSKSSGFKSNNQNDRGKSSHGTHQNNPIQGHCGKNNQGNSGDGDDDREKKPKHPMEQNIKDEEDENSDEDNTEDDRVGIYPLCTPSNEKGIEERLHNLSKMETNAELCREHFDQDHSSLTVDQLCLLLGQISERPSWNVFGGLEHALDVCFTRIMHQLHLASFDVDFVTDCQTCQVLEGLFRHLAYSEDFCEANCNVCHQICTLITCHIEVCVTRIQPGTFRTSTDLCFKICQAVMGNVKLLRNDPTIIRMVIEYCSNVLKILPDNEDQSELNEPIREPEKSSQSSLTDLQHGGFCQDVPFICNAHTSSSSSMLTGHCASIAATEEISFVFGHKSSNQCHPLDIIDETTELLDGEQSDIQNFHLGAMQNDLIRNQSSSVGFYHSSQASNPKDAEAVMRKVSPGYALSMPEGTINDGTQFHSLADKPTGIKGIGEVVFADSDRLCLVAKYWTKKKEECEETNQKPSQLREEGVILERYKPKFNILLTRYQQDNQWKQLTNLGYGMHGRCFLAMDMETEHQFCVKKVDLLHYEANELCLWADLDNPYIVHLYGAIRHGYHVYIFAEFIDGGDLAYVIREEKARGQRLSHWTAISYFQQLLKALAYLQSNNILHEDIKAENILLRGNSPHIAVTDFGISRRLQGQIEMKNKWPAGTATHFSPEKAASMGHGFPADVWAAICVLVYMMSGKLPWQKYLKGADCLNFIIFMRPPPMDDLPINIQDVVRDLIAKGFVKEPEKRPSAMELLKHPAFQILNAEIPDSFYSTLMTGLNSVGGAGQMVDSQDVGKALDKQTNVAQSVQKNEDVEPMKSACSDTILYSLSIPQEISGIHLVNDVHISHLEEIENPSVILQLSDQFEGYSMKESLSRRHKKHIDNYHGAENNLAVRNVYGIIQEQGVQNFCDQDKGLSPAKIPVSLLPKLDELLPSSPNPVKDFFKDSYDSMQTFNERNYTSRLEVFEPLNMPTPDLIPHLSIFSGSIDMSHNEIMALPNFGHINSGSLQGQKTDAGDILGLLVDNPSSIDECIVSNEYPSSRSPEIQKGADDFSLSFESNLKLDTREENPIIRPFVGLGDPSHSTILRNSADVRKGSDVSIMRKKPQNLTLDVSKTVQQQISQSDKREIRYLSVSAHTGPLSPPNGSAFANGSDIFTQQDQEYKDIMSGQSSENGKFSGLFAVDPESDTEETNIIQRAKHDVETTRLTDETPPEGKKISFHTENNMILFSMRFFSTPVSLHHHMSEIRSTIYGYGYKHFELQHMDGSRISRSSEPLFGDLKIKNIHAEYPCCCIGCTF